MFMKDITPAYIQTLHSVRDIGDDSFFSDDQGPERVFVESYSSTIFVGNCIHGRQERDSGDD